MNLLQYLQSVQDPRMQRTRRHDLQAMLAMALCGTLAGADNWVEVVQFAQLHKDWFARFLHLPSGVASHDTFARVFRLLDAQQLERACLQWLQQTADQVQGTVAIDGKSVRGSRKGDAAKALHLVSAWAADMGLLLGQRKVDGKSNEIQAIPELLAMLHLKGCIVTIDAIGCQKSIAGQLHEHGADYVLSLKGNQKHMRAVVQKHFESSSGHSVYSESFAGHGRKELRQYRVSPIPEALQRAAAHWPGLSCVVQVQRQRQQGSKGASNEVSYYLSSLLGQTPAHVLAHSIRAHWSVENQLHWKSGCGYAKGRGAVVQGSGAAQPECAQAHGVAAAQERDIGEGRGAGQAQEGWMGSGLPGSGHWPDYLDAIALGAQSSWWLSPSVWSSSGPGAPSGMWPGASSCGPMRWRSACTLLAMALRSGAVFSS